MTGPTGSGKTTTLYAGLAELNTPDRTIVTVEDPVEYELEGVKQVQVNPKTGLTFATGLRAMVRADPDVIMVGEIRDPETAQIAIESALTGHLVLTTLHANDAPLAAARLIDMGIEPFLVTSSVECVVAQRLVRRLCECKVPVKLSKATLAENGFDQPRGFTAFEPGGCVRCGQTRLQGPHRPLRGHDDDRRAAPPDPRPARATTTCAAKARERGHAHASRGRPREGPRGHHLGRRGAARGRQLDA